MQTYGKVSVNRNINLSGERQNTLSKIKNITAQFYNSPTFENKGSLKHFRASKNSM